jgi:hypothetical protein
MSGMLWYELFSTTLQDMGFVINPYDFCVANANIEGSQCTVGWYVDDTMIAHKNPAVTDHILQQIESKFGAMTITRGRQHEFLGMNITFHDDGTASILMPSYIQTSIDESGLNLSPTTCPTPCAGSLFTIDPNSPRLSQAASATFHRVVARLIYVAARARPDILLALAFLCGRVSQPTVQDENKLRQLLGYLADTISLELRLGADSLHEFWSWVVASFATHPEMHSHTGGVISFGRGGIVCKSKKQKINTKSSTEAELIGASDNLPHTLYVKMFMKAQGYSINKATFYQDNKRAIKMELNGKASTGQRSRHIDVHYFFITDHSKRSNVTIVHCPTSHMLADFFTKPLQEHISTLRDPSQPLGAKERVEMENISISPG